MMRHPLSASERRGIIVIALVALCVTGAGIIVPRCTRPASRIEASDVTVFINADTTANSGSESTSVRSSRKSKRRSSSKGKPAPKKPSYRSPHDENPL